MAYLEVKNKQRFVVYQDGDIMVEYENLDGKIQRFLNFKDFSEKPTRKKILFKIGTKKLNEIFITDKGKIFCRKENESILTVSGFDFLKDINEGEEELQHLPFRFREVDYYAIDFWPLPLYSQMNSHHSFVCGKCGYAQSRPLIIISSVVDYQYKKPIDHDEVVFEINHSKEGREILRSLSKNNTCLLCNM